MMTAWMRWSQSRDSSEKCERGFLGERGVEEVWWREWEERLDLEVILSIEGSDTILDCFLTNILDLISEIPPNSF